MLEGLEFTVMNVSIWSHHGLSGGLAWIPEIFEVGRGTVGLNSSLCGRHTWLYRRYCRSGFV